jgi:hypothetical protein
VEGEAGAPKRKTKAERDGGEAKPVPKRRKKDDPAVKGVIPSFPTHICTKAKRRKKDEPVVK